MKKEIKTQIIIEASPERVWDIFTRFSAYKEWNPFIHSIEGNVAEGNTIKTHLTPPGSGSMIFRPKVLVFRKYQQFTWKGHFLIPGLFDGEHTFELIDNGNGTTTFSQREKFNGILLPFLTKMLDTTTIQGFNLMNEKLKERCEVFLGVRGEG